jgi:hypothetical protein
MSRTSRLSTTLVGLTAAAVVGIGFAGASSASAAELTPAINAQPISADQSSDPLGPFEYESSCLRRGNQGVEDGEWGDYTCDGGYGNWWVHPIY